MGPVELVLSHSTPLTLFLPHSTEVAAARRILVGPGVALTLRQLKGISLRKPVDLATLPPSYLAEVRRGTTGCSLNNVRSKAIVDPRVWMVCLI